ncbi:GNAT family N-acetyltransferase [Streptococcus caprae]|uniref:GNAT family N-acetyltransferase n=1 Tax=Streptococcus caprae TaxID=1640501 RepID=A0ABV8CX64_9STRE
MSLTMSIRQGKPEDLEILFSIEYENFGPEIGMPKSVMAAYLAKASETFLVVEFGTVIAGYIMGTMALQANLIDEYFFSVPSQSISEAYVAVTGLSVSEAFQGQGIGTMLLAAMKDLVVSKGHKGIVLTCEEGLVPYYEMNGFEDYGLSESKLGNQEWIKMVWLAQDRADIVTKP